MGYSQSNISSTPSTYSSTEKTVIKKSDEAELIFEYIDKKEKLIFPLFFKTLIDNESNNSLEKYNNLLYKTYSKENEEIKKLLSQIISRQNIPVEILSKYYARLYTLYSNFYLDLNKDLRLNKIDKNLPYIKTLYEGVKLKSLLLSTDNKLYRGSIISNKEINDINSYLNKKVKDLPGSIVFSKSFLSFSKDEKEAKKFLDMQRELMIFLKYYLYWKKMIIKAIIYQRMVI